jgi:hypothetical protein
MEYLGCIVSGGKLYVSTKKVKAVKEWLVPNAQREVCSFVQLYIFYAKFIYHFDDLSTPLTNLLRKSHPQHIMMTPTCMESFEALKLSLIVRAMSSPSGGQLGRDVYRGYKCVGSE